MSLLATSPTSLLVDPISKTPHEFLLLYKEAHKLKFVPPPTIEHKVLADVFNKINGHEMRKKPITEVTQIEKTTENTTKPVYLHADAENWF